MSTSEPIAALIAALFKITHMLAWVPQLPVALLLNHSVFYQLEHILLKERRYFLAKSSLAAPLDTCVT
jgi:hypothetical protein